MTGQKRSAAPVDDGPAAKKAQVKDSPQVRDMKSEEVEEEVRDFHFFAPFIHHRHSKDRKSSYCILVLLTSSSFSKILLEQQQNIFY